MLLLLILPDFASTKRDSILFSITHVFLQDKLDIHKFKEPSPPPGEHFFYETFTDHEKFETRSVEYSNYFS